MDFQLAKQKLQNAIVILDVVDAHHKRLSPEDYQDLARATRVMMRTYFGHVPLRSFAGSVKSLQTTAENIYFEGRHHFADLGDRKVCDMAFEVSESLYARLGCRLRLQPEPLL